MTQDKIKDAVERVKDVIELRALPAIYEGKQPRSALASDLNTILSHLTALQERVRVLEGAGEVVRDLISSWPADSVPPGPLCVRAARVINALPSPSHPAAPLASEQAGPQTQQSDGGE